MRVSWYGGSELPLWAVESPRDGWLARVAKQKICQDQVFSMGAESCQTRGCGRHLPPRRCAAAPGPNGTGVLPVGVGWLVLASAPWVKVQ